MDMMMVHSSACSYLSDLTPVIKNGKLYYELFEDYFTTIFSRTGDCEDLTVDSIYMSKSFRETQHKDPRLLLLKEYSDHFIFTGCLTSADHSSVMNSTSSPSLHMCSISFNKAYVFQHLYIGDLDKDSQRKIHDYYKEYIRKGVPEELSKINCLIGEGTGYLNGYPLDKAPISVDMDDFVFTQVKNRLYLQKGEKFDFYQKALVAMTNFFIDEVGVSIPSLLLCTTTTTTNLDDAQMPYYGYTIEKLFESDKSLMFYPSLPMSKKILDYAKFESSKRLPFGPLVKTQLNGFQSYFLKDELYPLASKQDLQDIEEYIYTIYGKKPVNMFQERKEKDICYTLVPPKLIVKMFEVNECLFYDRLDLLDDLMVYAMWSKRK
jgi:hypothetical protein